MKIHENIQQLLLAAIMGVVSLGVSYMRDMAKEVQTISAAMIESRAENNLKFSQLTEIVKDHETRIRETERSIKRRQ